MASEFGALPRVRLHGDIHEEAAEVVGWMGAAGKKGLHVEGTGSFGAGGEGTPRLYSLLEVDRDFGRVVVHMRAQRRAGEAFGPHAVAGAEDADGATGRYEIEL